MRRRTFAEIRNEIQEALSRRPMNLNELANTIRANPAVVKRHLEYLEAIGVVRKFEMRWKNDTKILWMLVK